MRWVVRGEETTEGKDDVIAACEQTITELTDVTTEFTRFVVAADDDTAAVDATGRYTGPDGTNSVVSSCDIFEFHEGLVVRITSYAVEEEAR